MFDSKVFLIARRHVAQAFGPGSDWFGQCIVEVNAEDLWPYLMERKIAFPLPVIMSPTVRTLRYLRHLFRLMRSRFGNDALMNSSIKKWSVSVMRSRDGELSWRVILFRSTKCQRFLIQESVVRKCVCLYGVAKRLPGMPSSSLMVCSHSLIICPIIELEATPDLYFIIFIMP